MTENNEGLHALFENLKANMVRGIENTFDAPDGAEVVEATNEDIADACLNAVWGYVSRLHRTVNDVGELARLVAVDEAARAIFTDSPAAPTPAERLELLREAVYTPVEVPEELQEAETEVDPPSTGFKLTLDNITQKYIISSPGA